jgi:hypothetical protein
MKNNNTSINSEQVMKRLSIYILLAVFLSPMVYSQTFTMTGNSATFYNQGVIRFVDNNGKFRTTSTNIANVSNSGTIQFDGTDNQFTDETDATGNAGALGSTSALRVDGTVNYSATVGTQNLQNRYYTNLQTADASTKAFPNNLFVSEDYLVSGGDRDYDANSGTFTFDGTSSQTITGENGTGATNGYNSLFLTNTGDKFIENGGDVRVMTTLNVMASTNSASFVIKAQVNADDYFTQGADAATVYVDGVDGNASLSFGSTQADIYGDIELRNGAGTATAHVGAGGLTIQDGTSPSILVNSGTFNVVDGDLEIASSTSNSFQLTDDANAAIIVGTSRSFTVTGGGFTNDRAVGLRTNMNFDDASFVVYDTDGSVVRPDITHPYGKLYLKGTGNGVEGGSGTYYVSDEFNLSGADWDISGSTTISSHTFIMTDKAAPANYSGGVELTGLMIREFAGGATAATTYTLNNEASTVDFESGAGVVTSVGLDVRPGGASAGYMTNYDNARDVDRTAGFYYESSATFESNIQMGYKSASEAVGHSTLVTESLRFREDDRTGNTKVSTGYSYARNSSSSPFETVYYRGIRQGGDVGSGNFILAGVDAGNVLFLRGGPTYFISKASGRWANPATWDENEQPGPNDIAVVKHNVHVGYTKSTDSYGANDDGTEEQAWIGTFTGSFDNTELVSKIIIDEEYNDVGNPTNIATLMVGQDVTMGIRSDASLDGLVPDHGSIQIKDNANIATIDKPSDLSTEDATATEVNSGLIVYAGATFLIQRNWEVGDNGVFVGPNATVTIDKK